MQIPLFDTVSSRGATRIEHNAISKFSRKLGQLRYSRRKIITKANKKEGKGRWMERNLREIRLQRKDRIHSRTEFCRHFLPSNAHTWPTDATFGLGSGLIAPSEPTFFDQLPLLYNFSIIIPALSSLPIEFLPIPVWISSDFESSPRETSRRRTKNRFEANDGEGYKREKVQIMYPCNPRIIIRIF